MAMRRGEWRWEKCSQCGGSGYDEYDPSGAYAQRCFCRRPGMVFVPTKAREERMKEEVEE